MPAPAVRSRSARSCSRTRQPRCARAHAPVNPAQPRPADYAQALHEFLDRLLLKDVVLVGNSLGCLMAGAYAAAHPERVRGMVLLGPAGGYGSLADREARVRGRLEELERLGPEGL